MILFLFSAAPGPAQSGEPGARSLGGAPSTSRQHHTPRCNSFLKRTKTTPFSLQSKKATPSSLHSHDRSKTTPNSRSAVAVTTPTNMGVGRGFVFQKSSLHVAASASATKVCMMCSMYTGHSLPPFSLLPSPPSPPSSPGFRKEERCIKAKLPSACLKKATFDEVFQGTIAPSEGHQCHNHH